MNANRIFVGFAMLSSLSLQIASGQVECPSTQDVTPETTQDSPFMRPSLPADFLQKHTLEEIKEIARQRHYKMHRIVEIPGIAADMPYRPIRDVLEELCQSPDESFVDVGLELIAEADRKPDQIASMIASSHDQAFVTRIIEKNIAVGKYSRVITPLVQESVLRGENYETSTIIKQYWDNLDRSKEPLAKLPLSRLEIETQISFPQYMNGGSANSYFSASPNVKAFRKAEAGKSVHSPQLMPTYFNQEDSVSEIPYGKKEAKLFKSHLPVECASVTPNELLRLKLDCLQGGTSKNTKMEKIGAIELYSDLFSVCTNGGAYGPNIYAARGRLATWKTLAAITGMNQSDSYNQICDAVKHADWWSFNSESKWFANIAWDMGIVCLRKDRHNLVILAASDED